MVMTSSSSAADSLPEAHSSGEKGELGHQLSATLVCMHMLLPRPPLSTFDSHSSLDPTCLFSRRMAQ